MRILFHHRIASRDGQAVHIEELIAALRRQGHETISVGPPSFMATGFGGSNPLVDRIKRLFPGTIYELLEIGYNAKAFLRLRAAVRAHRPDIIYERFSLFLFAGLWIHRLSDVPMLLEVNSPLYEERTKNDGLRLHRLGRWAQRLLWNHVDHILPVTRVLARTVTEYGVRPSSITVIPNGIDPERFPANTDIASAKAAPGLPPRLTLGFTGFIRGWNAVHRLIDFVALHHARFDLHVLVVGDGPARNSLLEHAGVQLGRAIVAPDTENIREVLTHGRDALLFDPAEEGALEKALLRLCADATLRAELGCSARQTITSRSLTWDSNAQRVVTVAEAVIEQRRGSSLVITPE
jgi:glycosyltransferase involved in cell wall biosynthesis